jgi:hypothetical protein
VLRKKIEAFKSKKIEENKKNTFGLENGHIANLYESK